MTTKHTPGPWRVTQEWSTTKLQGGFGVEAPTPEGPGFPTPSATGFYAMALPPPHGHDAKSRALQEANARLIAAAPELLEACEQVQFASTHELNNVERLKQMSKGLMLVRTAIAKAEGGAP